jgi:hypothetical protein
VTVFRLVPYQQTRSQPGDAGVVQNIREDEATKNKLIDVRFNNGSRLSLIDGFEEFLKVA